MIEDTKTGRSEQHDSGGGRHQRTLSFREVVEDPSRVEEYALARGCDVDECYFREHGDAGVALIAREEKYSRRRWSNSKLEDNTELELRFWMQGERIQDDPEFAELIFSMLDLKYNISMFDYRVNKKRSLGLRRLYALFAFILSTPFAGPGDHDRSLPSRSLWLPDRDRKSKVSVAGAPCPDRESFKLAVGQEFDSIQDFYQRSIDRELESRYSIGLFAGFGLMIAITFLLAWWVPGILRWLLGVAVNGPLFQAFLVAMLSGSLGAILSVMMRMSSKRPRLRSDLDPSRMTLIGLLRPVVGSLFGIAIYVLILAGFLPLSGSPGAELAMAAALGFLAGFSERWAKDVVTNAAGSVPSGTHENLPASRSVDQRLPAMATPRSVDERLPLAMNGSGSRTSWARDMARRSPAGAT